MAEAILSVGIDIGTSTTQVVFSRLHMDNMAGYFSAPRIAIVRKELVYRGAVHTTPLQTASLLDGEGIRRIVEEEYRRAGFRPADLDTGAVIITGESARKENAELVSQRLGGLAGEFVVATAGPDLESVLAGKGSGAFQYSLDRDCVVANLDIGGGTTNIVLFDRGETAARGCFDIGGRLLRLDRDYTVRSVSPAAQTVARAVGVRLAVGERTGPEALEAVTDKMAQLLAQSLGLLPREPLLEAVRTPGSSYLPPPGHIDRVCYSGGVAAVMAEGADGDPLAYGDIGIFLGRSIQNHPLLSSESAMVGSETIRATVVGAGTYTTSLSGSTITCDPEIFPLKNLPVLRLNAQEQADCLAGRGQGLVEKGRWFLEQGDSSRMILALPGKPDPDYGELKAMAECIVEAMDRLLPPGEPVVVLLEQDTAKALGMLMRSAARGLRRVAAIDGIRVEENDYVDIGRPLMGGVVVPVIIKTLVFG